MGLDALHDRLLARLNMYSRVRTLRSGDGGGAASAAADEVLQKGAIRGVRVSVEDRHAGRKVSRERDREREERTKKRRVRSRERSL